MYCVETVNITHKFSEKDTVLNNINLQVPQGAIYGFLGPNGAGKTTTLRLVLGLLKMQQGTVKIFGKPFTTHRIEILKKLGSLIESPSLYGHLTAAENLRVLQTVYQCPPQRIKDVLDIVGLPDTGGKKAARFSLGMKQRLSIAIALLHNPALLILDEPTNGLDPNGIIEIRELLKKLNKEHGMTILISSHLLSEIEKMVTHVGIIHQGCMLFQGTLAELQSKQTIKAVVQFTTNNIAKTVDIILAAGLAPTVANELVTMPAVDKEMVATLNAQLVRAGIEVYEIGHVKNDLESLFMDIINN
jgi:lantibiotic transport system ATP-binding protein